jgi:hypothetical protein
MVDMSSIAALASSLKITGDMAKAAVGLRDAEAMRSKVIEFQSAILDAQHLVFSANEERTALIDRVGALEKELASMKEWNTGKGQYQLESVDAGKFAYVPKPVVGSTEPPHWLCTHCFENRKKSILQCQTEAGRDNVWICPSCSMKILISQNITPTA